MPRWRLGRRLSVFSLRRSRGCRCLPMLCGDARRTNAASSSCTAAGPQSSQAPLESLPCQEWPLNHGDVPLLKTGAGSCKTFAAQGICPVSNLWVWFPSGAPGSASAAPHPDGSTGTRPQQLPSLSLANARQQQGTGRAGQGTRAFVAPSFNSAPYSSLTRFCQRPKGLVFIKPDHGFLTQLLRAQSCQGISPRADVLKASPLGSSPRGC